MLPTDMFHTRPPVREPKDHVQRIEREIDLGLGGDDPVGDECNSDQESEQHKHPNDTKDENESGMFPLHGLFDKAWKASVAGSCCGSVAFLLLLSGWDHGWIPGLESQFAKSGDLQEFKDQGSDLKRLLVLNLAQAIRDVEQDICVAATNLKRQQLDSLQYEYSLRTGGRYPRTDCPRVAAP